MAQRLVLIIGVVAGLVAGCQSQPGVVGSSGSAQAADPSRADAQSSPGGVGSPAAGRAAAMVQGVAIGWDVLQGPLAEAAGGPVLMEVVTDRLVQRRLTETGQRVTDADISRERASFLESLSDDPNEAQRLFSELQSQRGLGPTRTTMLLRRNAGLRKLVGEANMAVSEEDVRNAFELTYGPRYEARLIVTSGLAEAQGVAAKLEASNTVATFVELAMRHSTDSSKTRGGLLSPLSPQDPSYPLAVRQAVSRLAPGQVSAPIALPEGGFAVLRLERKIDGRGVEFADVKESLRQRLLRRRQSVAMQQLARELIRGANIVVLDATLHEAWKEQTRSLRD